MRAWPNFLVSATILFAPALAHADLRGAPTPVTEAGCEVAVELDGPIARVTERHRLVPGGTEPAAAAYSWTLAPGALVDEFTVTAGGRDEAGLLVPGEALEQRTPASLGLAPDLGVMRIGDGPAVEVQVYPVAPGRVTGFTVRWSAPATYADGALAVTLPARGASANLSRCKVKVDARAGSGVRGWSGVRAAGVWLGEGARVQGTVSGWASDAPLTIEAQPRWSGSAPVLAAAHADVGGTIASSIGLYVPDHATRKRFAPARLLFVVDTSKSVGPAGRKAAAALVDTLGRAAPPGTPVEAVLFDRDAHRAIGTWVGADIGGVERIERAIREAPDAGGTELTTALRLASDVIGDDDAHVIVITDAMLPTDHTGAALLGHFPVTTAKVSVDVLVPLVDGAAPPEHGALEVLTNTFHGRVLAFPADRAMPASALTEGLAAALPITDISVTADGDDVELEGLPDTIAGGAGVLLTTTLERRPRALVLHAERGGSPLTTKAIALPSSAARFAASHVQLDDDVATLAAARRLHLAGPGYASVVIDRRATGGAARIDLARRTGLYTYNAPPDELTPRTQASASPRVWADPKIRHFGELPRASVMAALRDQLAPRLRICYRDALRAEPKLTGTLEIELEIARGEVMAVNLSGDHFPEQMIGCVAKSAYALSTPTYELGGVADTVYIARKPVSFTPPPAPSDEPTVVLDDILYGSASASPPPVEVSPDSPL